MGEMPDADVTEKIREKATAARLPEIWRRMPIDEKADDYVRPLMDIGHTDASAAKILGLSRGQVSGVRFRKKIPLKNPKVGFAAINAAKKAARERRSAAKRFERWRRKRNKDM